MTVNNEAKLFIILLARQLFVCLITFLLLLPTFSKSV